jgi:hypothetical protein
MKNHVANPPKTTEQANGFKYKTVRVASYKNVAKGLAARWERKLDQAITNMLTPRRNYWKWERVARKYTVLITQSKHYALTHPKQIAEQ